MRKTAYSLLVVFLFLAGLSALCFAATMDQLAGDYPMEVVEKVSIKKIGKDSWQGFSILTLYSNGDWEDIRGGQGTAALDAKGKKLIMQYDNTGLAALEEALVSWAYDAALDEGISASGLDFSFTEMNPVKCKIDKKTNRVSKKIKVKGTGTFSGTLDGQFISTTFKYQMKACIM
jgi:hypothetical protein